MGRAVGLHVQDLSLCLWFRFRVPFRWQGGGLEFVGLACALLALLLLFLQLDLQLVHGAGGGWRLRRREGCLLFHIQLLNGVV